jgi:hypothetical protein
MYQTLDSTARPGVEKEHQATILQGYGLLTQVLLMPGGGFLEILVEAVPDAA